MFRALKPHHIRRRNKTLRLTQIPTTNWSAPYRPAINRTIRLQYILFILVISGDGAADVADGDGECSFPAGTLGTGVAPLGLQGGLDAGVGCGGGVVVAGYVVGVEGRVYDVLEEVLVRCDGLLGWGGVCKPRL